MSAPRKTGHDRDAGLSFPWDGPPGPGELREVAPGVHWLRMPLPFRLDHINLWLLEDGESWTLVDSGFADDATRGLWARILSGPAAGRPIARLICTHFHPDHFGLAGWFQAAYGARLQMTQGEFLTGQFLGTCPDDRYAEGLSEHFRRHGLEAARAERLAAKGNAYAKRIGPLPQSYDRLRDGQDVTIGGRSWRIVVGEGHAPEHATLSCAELGVLIAGDQILPQITPNVSTQWYEPGANPLGLYLDSLERFRGLPDDTLVLPSHRLPFRGLQARLDSLAHHHDRRLDDAEQACRAGGAHSAADLLPVLFKIELDDHHLSFAMGEAIAHLDHLVGLGRLSRTADADGIVRYRARAAAE